MARVITYESDYGRANVCEQIAVEDGREERQTQTLDELDVTVY